MVESTTEEAVVAEVTPEVTEESLKLDVAAALRSNDWRTVAKVSAKLVKFQSAAENAETEAKQAALASITAKVKDAIEKAIKPIVESEEFKAAEGIWYTWDFGEQLSSIRVLKTATKAPRASSGGGGGKKFDVSTESLLEKHGEEPMPSKEGEEVQTFKEAYAAAEGDGNKRYRVRQALLKADGVLT